VSCAPTRPHLTCTSCTVSFCWRPYAAASQQPRLTFAPRRPRLQIDFVLCSCAEAAQQLRLRADTVIMNPPFGTKRKGADMEFLRAAFSLASRSVYSLHKSSTRDHILKVAQRWGRGKILRHVAR
jgi:predicted RNA methylase